MMRGVIGFVAAIAVAGALTTEPARASKAGDVIAGIAIGAGVAALAAASASAAQRYRGDPYYDYNQGLSPEGNAIAACSHAAWRQAARQGAKSVTLRKVKDTRSYGRGEWRVKLRMQARFRHGNKDRYDVVCRVIHDRVVRYRES